MSSRRVLAALWLFTLGLGLIGLVGEDGRMLFASWVSAVVLSFVTAIVVKPAREEQPLYPIAYRATAGLLLVAALAGAVFGLVPGARGTSQLLAVFFGVAALLAYRAVLARGASTAMWAVVITSWIWLPFTVLTLLGCKCGRRVQHWSEIASYSTLQVVLLALPLLAAVALLGFEKREDGLPEARVI